MAKRQGVISCRKAQLWRSTCLRKRGAQSLRLAPGTPHSRTVGSHGSTCEESEPPEILRFSLVVDGPNDERRALSPLVATLRPRWRNPRRRPGRPSLGRRRRSCSRCIVSLFRRSEKPVKRGASTLTFGKWDLRADDEASRLGLKHNRFGAILGTVSQARRPLLNLWPDGREGGGTY